MKYSESKGERLSAVCERIKLTTTVIKLRKMVKWIKATEWCCVGFGITIMLWEIYNLNKNNKKYKTNSGVLLEYE